jgi:hypothetical protein
MLIKSLVHRNARIALEAGLLACLFAFCGFSLRGQALSPAWVELGPGGSAIVRIVVTASGDCPKVKIDGKSRPTRVRPLMPAGFRPVCQAGIPAGARTASVNGQKLALPRPNPSRVVVFGDTGCRIKGNKIQDCNDVNKWPFLQVASDAAQENPDLVIHVGDFLYREIPCPAGSEAKCGGTPAGDNWDAWNADFFTPAAKLLTTAPWAFSRGNHETCERSWRGWFYYLDPRDWDGTCTPYSGVYVIQLGKFQLAMLDSSSVKEDLADEQQISTYAAELSSLHMEHGWLVDHHPFWGFKSNEENSEVKPIAVPLEEAWKRAAPKGIDLILSGHIHLFEFVGLDAGHPAQLVAGDGGTDMAVPVQTPANGTVVRGASVTTSETLHEWGYTLLVRQGSGWQLSLKNHAHKVLVTCSISNGPANCTMAPAN